MIVSLADGATLDTIDLPVTDDECTALAWADDDRVLLIATRRQLVLRYVAAR